MLVARLVSLSERSPKAKRWLWRSWYQFLARRYREPSWTFMNYGYRAPEGESAAPMPEIANEHDRSCAQLYDTIAAMAPLAGREVLEVGCGRGGGAAFVARRHAPRRLVAVDVSPNAVALCRARHDVPGLSFDVGDAEALPFGDGAFDAVLNVESSHCYGRIDAFFREVRRVLRPGGVFLYADFRPRDALPAWRAALAAAGLRCEVERDLSPGVLAALDADDARKRTMIDTVIDRPLTGVFHQFAGLRGTILFDELRTGALAYLAFKLTPA